MNLNSLNLAIEYFQNSLKIHFDLEKNTGETAIFLRDLLNSKNFGTYRKYVHCTLALFGTLAAELGLIGNMAEINGKTVINLEDVQFFLQKLLNEKAGGM